MKQLGRYTWFVLIPLLLVLAVHRDALPITGELSVIPGKQVQASAGAGAAHLPTIIHSKSMILSHFLCDSIFFFFFEYNFCSCEKANEGRLMMIITQVAPLEVIFPESLFATITKDPDNNKQISLVCYDVYKVFFSYLNAYMLLKAELVNLHCIPDCSSLQII